MKYTPEQLKDLRDAIDAHLAGKPVQCLCIHPPNHKNTWGHHYNSGPFFDCENYAWRPKPEPKTRQWSKPEDVPMNCWIYFNTPPRNAIGVLVVAVLNAGVVAIEDVIGGSGTFELTKWEDLKNCNYSTDRKTWQPCVVTEP